MNTKMIKIPQGNEFQIYVPIIIAAADGIKLAMANKLNIASVTVKDTLGTPTTKFEESISANYIVLTFDSTLPLARYNVLIEGTYADKDITFNIHDCFEITTYSNSDTRWRMFTPLVAPTQIAIGEGVSEADIYQIKSDLADLDEQLLRFAGNNNNLENSIENLKTSNSSVISSQQKTISSQQTTIEDLRQKNNDLRTTNRQQAEYIEAADIQIDDLQANLDEANGKIAELETVSAYPAEDIRWGVANIAKEYNLAAIKSGYPLTFDTYNQVLALDNVPALNETAEDNLASTSRFFFSCSRLKRITFQKPWNTAAVTTMVSMFDGCTALQSLDLSGWNTAAVTKMENMFRGCTALQSLDLSGWNTAAVTTMGSMFYGCTALQSLDLSGWNTAAVTTMGNMFDGCTALQSLDLSGWNIKHKSFSYFFRSVGNLRYLDIRGWQYDDITVIYNGVLSALPSWASTSTTPILKLDASLWNALTTAQQTTITNKKWSVEIEELEPIE